MIKVTTKQDILKLIQSDIWMMNILKTVKKLNLPDWWIGAGFVRSKVWDTLHNYKIRTPLSDVDVIYFDKSDFPNDGVNSETTEKEIYYENLLKSDDPNVNWSVTNQARMHVFHNDKPYKSSEDGIRSWIETATCIGVRLRNDDSLTLTAPYGIEDLINLVLRFTPGTNNNNDKFQAHIEKKRWLKKWPKLRIVVK